jgi:hypothetical protein
MSADEPSKIQNFTGFRFGQLKASDAKDFYGDTLATFWTILSSKDQTKIDGGEPEQKAQIPYPCSPNTPSMQPSRNIKSAFLCPEPQGKTLLNLSINLHKFQTPKHVIEHLQDDAIFLQDPESLNRLFSPRIALIYGLIANH